MFNTKNFDIECCFIDQLTLFVAVCIRPPNIVVSAAAALLCKLQVLEVSVFAPGPMFME